MIVKCPPGRATGSSGQSEADLHLLTRPRFRAPRARGCFPWQPSPAQRSGRRDFQAPCRAGLAASVWSRVDRRFQCTSHRLSVCLEVISAGVGDRRRVAVHTAEAHRAQALRMFMSAGGRQTKSPGAIRVEEPGLKLLSRANPTRVRARREADAVSRPFAA